MNNLNVSLSNLLKNFNYQYALVSKKNTESKTTTTSSKSSTTSSSKTTVTTNTKNTNSSVKTTSSETSALSSLLKNISKNTKTLDNTSVITNDMVTEFFKSYKNSTMTAIYNKLQNGSAMSSSDLANFKAQVEKLSKDEQKLWKSEIANIERQITSKISNSTNTANSTNSANTANKTTTVNTANKTNTAKTTKNVSNNNSSSSLNGIISGVLYKNGNKYTGIYTDGKYYKNGVVASGTVDGKYYYNGVLANGTINGKTYENGVVKSVANTSNNQSSNTSNNSKDDSAIARKTTNSNGTVLGYNSSGKLVYLEKTVNGKKVVYTDELNYISAKTKSYLTSVSDSVLNDIKIVKNAEAAGERAGEKGSSAYQKAYDESIKSQMIKKTSSGVAGEVVEQNGSLYVNDGSKLVKLNISADTYLELFAPVDRYDINQKTIGDCYFVSGCLTDMMKNGTTYAQLLQMFSEDSNGNITVNFSGSLSSYPVTFNNGELKTFDGKANNTTVKKYTNASGSKGTQMLEQAYSIARFANESKKSVNSIDIDETIATIDGGWQYNVYSEVLGEKSERIDVDANNIASYLNSVANQVNNGDILFSFANYSDMSKYSLIYAHAYSIEKIDTAKQTVYITNPWFSGGSIAVPYSDFAKVAYKENNRIYFNLGYINA